LEEATGLAGTGLTTTVTVPAADVQPLIVLVTKYVPEANVVAPAMLGFGTVLVKPFGPVQFEAPVTIFAERFRVLPAQIGPLLEGAGVIGVKGVFRVTGPA
jgi:hypothetical protein